jgi:hypothetical protein
MHVTWTTLRCPNKLNKLFGLKIFSICHWCQQHRWCTLSCKYVREFLKKIKTALLGYRYSGAWRRLIYEKTCSRKSCGNVPLKYGRKAFK